MNDEKFLNYNFFLANSSTTSSSKKDSDTQPIKSGTLTDLDEEVEKGEDSQTAKFNNDVNNQVNNTKVIRLFFREIGALIP